MNKLTLNAAADFFNIEKIVKTNKIREGLGNQNYLLTTSSGKEYVLRKLVTQTIKGIENEFAIQKQLSRFNILTPHFLIGNNGGYHLKINDDVFTCTEKIVGVHPTTADVHLCEQTGKILALFHKSVTKIPHPHKGWLNKEIALRDSNKLENDPFSYKVKNLINNNLDLFNSKMQTGYVHGDLHFQNMLITENGEIAIFDFEECEKNLLILDIARTITEVCQKQNKLHGNLIHSFINGYESVRIITRTEKDNMLKAIQYVSGASATWLYLEGFKEYAKENIAITDNLDKDFI